MFVKPIMMKKITLIFVCFVSSTLCYSQTIKISNGVSLNSMKGDKFDLFPKQVVSYSGLLGLEYLESKWFYLSSEIGYLKLGGKENSTLNGVPMHDKQTWDFAQLNTSFRLRANSRKSEFYLGAGPYLNLLVGSGKFNKALYDGYSTEKTNWGLKTEVGINENIEKFRIGLNCSYLVPFSPVVKSAFTSINARSLGLYVSLGYRLK